MKKDKKNEVDRIKQIMFGKKVSADDDDSEVKESEVNEEGEESPPPETETSTPDAGAPGIWSSGLTRGKANPIENKPWESGVARGKANQLK